MHDDKLDSGDANGALCGSAIASVLFESLLTVKGQMPKGQEWFPQCFLAQLRVGHNRWMVTPLSTLKRGRNATLKGRDLEV